MEEDFCWPNALGWTLSGVGIESAGVAASQVQSIVRLADHKERFYKISMALLLAENKATAKIEGVLGISKVRQKEVSVSCFNHIWPMDFSLMGLK